MFLFDADCSFCVRCAGLLERRSAKGTYAVVAWQSVNLEALGLTPQQCQEASWYVAIDGSLHRGSDGIGRALREGAIRLRLLGVLLTLPGVRVLARVVYRWVAQNRYLMPGASDQCRMPEGGR